MALRKVLPDDLEAGLLCLPIRLLHSKRRFRAQALPHVLLRASESVRDESEAVGREEERELTCIRRLAGRSGDDVGVGVDHCEPEDDKDDEQRYPRCPARTRRMVLHDGGVAHPSHKDVEAPDQQGDA